MQRKPGRSTWCRRAGNALWVALSLLLVVCLLGYFVATRAYAPEFELLEPPKAEMAQEAGEREVAVLEDVPEDATDVLMIRSAPKVFPLTWSKALHGKVLWDMELPKDANPELLLEVGFQAAGPPDANDLTNGLEDLAQGPTFVERRRLALARSGEFEINPVRGVTHVRLRVEGDYSYAGDFSFEVGSDEDPRKDALTLHAKVGAHVTLQLRFPEDASQADKDALVGRKLLVDYPDESSGFLFQQAGRTIDEAWQLVIPRCAPGALSYAPDYDVSKPDSNLAPFCLTPFLQESVKAGVRERFDLELVLGQSIQGFVLTGAGEPLPDVRISVQWKRSNGSSMFMTQSDAYGGFGFFGVPSGVGDLTAEKHGYEGASMEE